MKSQTRSGTSHEFHMEEVVKAVTLRNMGLRVDLAATIAQRNLKSLKDLSIGIFQFQRGTYFTGHTEIIGVSGIHNDRKRPSAFKPIETLSYIAKEVEIQNYFLKALLGGKEVVFRDDLKTSRIAERTMHQIATDRNLNKEERLTQLKGRVKYLVKTSPVEFISKMESLVRTGVTWTDTLNSRLWG